jgi:hypothetical protein
MLLNINHLLTPYVEETKKLEHVPEEGSGVKFWKVMCIKHTL